MAVSLDETFHSPDSRIHRTVVAIDLTNSTQLKQERDESSWLPSYAWFYQTLLDTISIYHAGSIVKYLGDGAMAIFDEDNPHDAINWAISLQEQFAKAREARRISLMCSIGMAFGEMVHFLDPQNTGDYIGTTVDRAFRLCSAANSNAVFVDNNTVEAAAMTKVQSNMGSNSVPKRVLSEYKGEQHSWPAKGFNVPIPFYEILWASDRFGVRPETVSQERQGAESASDKIIEPERGDTISPPQPVRWLRGRVKNIVATGQFGFIDSAEGDHYFNPSMTLINGDTPQVGDIVLFSPSLLGEKKRANHVVVEARKVRAKLTTVREPGWGFAEILTATRYREQLFINLVKVGDWQVGDEIEVSLGLNPKGICGNTPNRMSDSERPAMGIT